MINFGAECGVRTHDQRFGRPRLYHWVNSANWRDRWDSNPRPFPWQGNILTNWTTTALYWRDWRDSNPRSFPWQGNILPTERQPHCFLERQEGIEPSPKHWQCFILPLKYWRILCFGGQCWNRTNRHIFVRDTLYQWVNCPFWRDRWDSNPRPFPWQGSILTDSNTPALYLGAIDRIRTCDLSPKREYLNHLNYYCI